LRCSSVELLITNRYLDEDDNLYYFAEIYFDSLQIINEHISRWSRSIELDKWFMEQKETLMTPINIFNKKIINVKEKL